MRRILLAVTDRRLTVSLFLAFLLLFCLGLILPQRPLLSTEEVEQLAARLPTLDRVLSVTGLDDLYRSWIMRVVFGACVVQLLAYLALRFPPLLRESLRPTPERPERMMVQLSLPGGAARREAVIAGLRRLGFPAKEWAPGQWFGTRHSWSGISGLVFHASLVILLAGAWLLKVSLFRGTVVLAEGQPFQGTSAEYLSFSPQGTAEEDLPQAAFTPQAIRPVFSDQDRAVDVTCEVQTGPPPGRGDQFAVNQPLQVGGAEVLIHGFDLAPVFVIREEKTSHLVDAQCVRLGVWSPGSPEDTFQLERPAATVHARFFPDLQQGPEGPSSASMEMRNPALLVRVETEGAYASTAEGLLQAGDSLDLGPYRLILEEFRTWGTFHVSRQTGWLLIVGFVVMVASISLRFFFVRQAVALREEDSAEGPVLHLGGRTAFFPESLRYHLEALVAGLPEAPEAANASEAPNQEESHGNR